MQIGCSLPARTFMPEYTLQDAPQSALQTLLHGYQTAMRLGYVYIEASVGAIRDLTADELSVLSDRIRNGTFRLRACNSFVPPTLPLCTSGAADIERFVCETMQMLSELDVHTVIFGSGVARRAPDGMSEEEAEAHILDFLHLCSRVGKQYGVITAIEPLNSTETNMINTVGDAARFAEQVGEDNIRLLPDLFHMAMEGESPSVLLPFRDRIVHLHASEAPGRVFPGKFGGVYLKRCADVLKAADWQGSVTVECVFSDFEPEAEQAIGFMKENYVWDLR